MSSAVRHFASWSIDAKTFATVVSAKEIFGFFQLFKTYGWCDASCRLVE